MVEMRTFDGKKTLGVFIFGVFMFCMVIDDVSGKDKAVTVTDHGSPPGCETSRTPHFSTVCLQMVVRSALLAGRPFPPRKILGTHFCYRISRPQGHNAAGMIRSIKKSSDLIGNEPAAFRLVA
jgi:hypothetical protein